MIVPRSVLIAAARRRAALRHAARVAAAALLAYGATWLLGLPQGVWAVVAALLVVQPTLGATLETARDRLIGAAAGAALGGLGAIWAAGDPIKLAVALPPLAAFAAFCAARRPSLKLAAMTSAIVLLADLGDHAPWTAALHRMGETLLGCVAGLAASLAVKPDHAGRSLAARAGRVIAALPALAEAGLASALDRAADAATIEKLDESARAELSLAEADAHAARDECAAHLEHARDPRPFIHAVEDAFLAASLLHRSVGPVTPEQAEILRPALTEAVAALRRRCLTLSTDLALGLPPRPVAADHAAALWALAQVAADLRGDLPAGEEPARLFVLAFAFNRLARALDAVALHAEDLKGGGLFSHPPPPLAP